MLAAVLLTCLGSGWWSIRHDHLEYARRATQLPIPEFRRIDICNDSDIAIGYYLVADSALAEAVEARRTERPEGFRQGAPLDVSVLQDCLPAPAESARLVYAAGCSAHQTWFSYLDPETRELWLEIHFPDWGGDDPGCVPGATRPPS